MAYAYPSENPNASSHSLLPRPGYGHGPASSRGSSRKGSDDPFEVLSEVRVSRNLHLISCLGRGQGYWLTVM